MGGKAQNQVTSLKAGELTDTLSEAQTECSESYSRCNPHFVQWDYIVLQAKGKMFLTA